MTSSHPIWAAVLSPARSVEVRAWLSRPENHAVARELRGPQGETLLHWAALSDLGLMLDLAGLGLDLNALDASGRSPVDWQFERLWVTHVENVGNLTTLNRKKLRLITDDLVPALWRQGGRPQSGALDIRALAVRSGLWNTLATWKDLEGAEAAFRAWGRATHALHHWPFAPAEAGRTAFLADWGAQGWSLDEPDADGATALRLAVEARLGATGTAALALDEAIDALLAAGASPDAVGADGLAVSQIPLVREASPEVIDSLAERLHPRSASLP